MTFIQEHMTAWTKNDDDDDDDKEEEEGMTKVKSLSAEGTLFFVSLIVAERRMEEA